MALRFLAIGMLGLVTGLTAASSSLPWHPSLAGRHAAGKAHLRVVGSRNSPRAHDPAASKLDGSLAELWRRRSSVRVDHAVEDLHNLNPAARFRMSSDGTPAVLIDAVTRGEAAPLQAALENLGLQRGAQFANDVSGWLPVAQLQAAAHLGEVHALRAAVPRTRAGAVQTQGDYVLRGDVVRSGNALDGSGVTVGILSDSYNCYATYAVPTNNVPAAGDTGYASNGFTATASTDLGTGDIPTGVNILAEAPCLNYGAPTFLPFGDEGRAMMQIVHDVAPGAGLAFYTAENGEAGFATGIGKLAAAGAKVIVDDVGYFDEPFFQDGILSQAIDTVAASGVAYFSSAGNDGASAYDNTAPDFSTTSPGTGENPNEKLLTIGDSGASSPVDLQVSIPSLVPGQFVVVVLQWDQPYVTGAPASGGATTQMDLCAFGVSGNDTIDATDANGNLVAADCSGANSLGADPYQVIFIINPADSGANSTAEVVNVQAGIISGPAPTRIKIAVEGDGSAIKIGSTGQFSGPTLQGHPGATGAAAVGAAFFFQTPDCGTTPATIEDYSARGGDPILFDTSGARLTAPTARSKPDFVGPDGGNDTFLGLTLASDGFTGGKLDTTTAACQNNPLYPNFFGTSAAAPHVAALAALYLQANAALTPQQIYTAMRGTALSMADAGSGGFGFTSGYGFVQADKAYAALSVAAPAAPQLSLSATSITLNQSATITWSSVNNQGCTASGNWSGAEASNGSMTVTPTAAGTATYTLVCSNSAGDSPATSVTLAVSGGASHGGGGALDLWTLLALAGLARASARGPLRRP